MRRRSRLWRVALGTTGDRDARQLDPGRRGPDCDVIGIGGQAGVADGADHADAAERPNSKRYRRSNCRAARQSPRCSSPILPLARHRLFDGAASQSLAANKRRRLARSVRGKISAALFPWKQPRAGKSALRAIAARQAPWSKPRRAREKSGKLHIVRKQLKDLRAE
jgi:hypothetical protein